MSGASFDVTDQQLAQDLDLADLASGSRLATQYPRQYTRRTRTAIQFLGADPDDHMESYICCPSCCKLTLLSELDRLETAICGNDRLGTGRCAASLFEQRLQARFPFKVVAYQPLSAALSVILQDQHFLTASRIGVRRTKMMRPGISQLPSLKIALNLTEILDL